MFPKPIIFYRIKTIFLVLVGSIWVAGCCAQLNFDFLEGKFLIKGTVVDLQTKRPIPLANIKVNSTGKGITCNNEGNFNLYVTKTDTLKFSSVGYITKVLHVHNLDSTNYYTLQVELLHDFIKLKEVTIYPFSSKEEFIEAFMEARNVGKLKIEGIAEPKYSHITPKAKLTNPISLLYERVKRKRAANPEFKP